jgi:hypothetical protein
LAIIHPTQAASARDPTIAQRGVPYYPHQASVPAAISASNTGATQEKLPIKHARLLQTRVFIVGEFCSAHKVRRCVITIRIQP